ncbi:MAG: ParB/RepB/Spo0J family partition protein [Piscinibacter sp.]|nr:ParB/RepB/Spo0J family partition protein [Piscinibacter sp.]
MEESIVQIPLEHLHESPFNPRLIYTGIEGLAENIKAEGRIHEPLLVRPRTNPMFKDDPEGATGFELVFGHRRLRAAQLAGLATAPCMVRAMTDAEARSAQIAENLQREDVHPLEEAVGMREMIEADGVTPEQIAARQGKSLAYVYARLKLNSLCDELREPFLKGEVHAENALHIARLPSVEHQRKALEYIRKESYRMGLDDGGRRSVREIRDMLVERFTLELKGAMFDPDDAALVPAAGACAACPKRSGNAPVFEDLVAEPKREPWQTRPRGADVCTDPDCFDAKKKAHLANKAAELEAKGKTVVTGAKARAAVDQHGKVKGAFIAAKDVSEELKKAKAKGKPVELVTILDPRSGKTTQAVKREDLVAAGVKKKEPAKRAQQRDWQAEQREKEARAEQITARNKALLARVRAASLERAPGALELRMIAAALVELVIDSDDGDLLVELWQEHLPGLAGKSWQRRRDEWSLQVEQLEPAQLTRLCLDCVLLTNVHVSAYGIENEPTNLLAAAEEYGVPLEEPADEGASTPSPAARAPEEAAAGAGAGKATKKAAAKKPKGRKTPPAAAGEEQTDDAGVAGGSDATTGALFEEAGA